MADALVARRPLGLRHDERLRSLGRHGRLRLTERPLETAFELQFDSRDDSAVARIGDATGLALASAAHRVVATPTSTALWLGPGHWLVKPRDAAALQAALERTAASYGLVDVSDLWFGVRIDGPQAPELLAKACALDLAVASFPPGASAVAQFVRLRALIHHVDEAPTYDVHVERSQAAYLWAWLDDAMTEFVDHEGAAR